MIAPAMKPPARPAPMAQPTQPPAWAGLGAASAAAPIEAAAARARRLFFMAGLLEGASGKPDRGKNPMERLCKGCSPVPRTKHSILTEVWKVGVRISIN